MAVTVKNNIKQFMAKAQNAADMVLSAMATDIMRLSKQQVPVDKGQLQNSGIIERKGKLQYRLSYNKEYAEYQHRGKRRDGTRVVRNYRYPGKKSHFLSDPGMQIKQNQRSYLERLKNP